MITALFIIALFKLIQIIVAYINRNKLKTRGTFTINKRLDAIFDYVSSMKNKDNFSLYNRADHEMNKKILENIKGGCRKPIRVGNGSAASAL